ncbi:hypothetical protein [Paenibacillus koleovorans]|uniref:hypothetical protein n=1 Tax=Paenibacillus koleovorans TaxID=121608 RepID=UPI000FDC6AE3|nr:hypothetical protein [Paenibacillus koleovorans]
MSRLANVGVLCDNKAAQARWVKGENVFEKFIVEVLEHAGIPFRLLHSAEEIYSCDVVIIALEPSSTDPSGQEILWDYAEGGGLLISFAGLNCFANRLGCVIHSTTGPGYAMLPNTLGDSRPLRYIEATIWNDNRMLDSDNPPITASLGMLKSSPLSEEKVLGAAMQCFPVGRGILHRWAVNLPATWVGLQQGTKPVTQDGFPAPDGTAAIDDMFLKADDSFELDWDMDRVKVGTGAAYFPYPYSDLWKEAFIGHLLKETTKLGLTLPFVGYWPDGIEQVAMISHDSDRNIDDAAVTTLAVLKEYNVRSTWCMLEPGYSPYIYEQVIADGHELALHYNAMEDQNGKWGEQEFARQINWLKKVTGLEQCTSNKNHYTRFEGWGELFQWCERHGVEADQTRGPSKKGNVGYLFGTCHPYFPIAYSDEENRFYNVLEMGFLIQDHQDHAMLAKDSVLACLLEEARRVKGVAHFLFHQFHVHNQPGIRETLRKVIHTANEYGFTFMTGKEINDWERARRNIYITGLNTSGEVEFRSTSIHTLHPEFVIWIPLTDNQDMYTTHTECRFGVVCRKQVASF